MLELGDALQGTKKAKGRLGKERNGRTHGQQKYAMEGRKVKEKERKEEKETKEKEKRQERKEKTIFFAKLK